MVHLDAAWDAHRDAGEVVFAGVVQIQIFDHAAQLAHSLAYSPADFTPTTTAHNSRSASTDTVVDFSPQQGSRPSTFLCSECRARRLLQISEDSTIARSTPQTFEKRRRERDKQQKQAIKAAARRERNDIKKAIKDGVMEAPGPEILEMADMQPMAFEEPPAPVLKAPPKIKPPRPEQP